MSISEEEKAVDSIKFFIFDTSREYPEQEEHKNIVYFYPSDTSRDLQMKEVGKTAAIIKFSQTFGANNASHALHTKKTRHYIYIPEPGFCMAMVIVPKQQDQAEQPIDLSDKVYHSLLMHSYSMFCLFMGTMKSALIQSTEPSVDELEQLKLRTAYFFPKHVQLMPLQDADLADAFLGVQFLPLDKLSFLKVRSLVNHIEQTFPWISFTTVLYQEQIVWSGLNPKDVQLVYNYLTTKLIPASNADSRFLTGPIDLNCATSEIRVPRVFLNVNNSTSDECHLVVYRTSGITVCLLAPALMELAREFFLTLDTLIGPRLAALSADLVEQAILRKTNNLNIGTDSMRFMYFNQWNMAFKSTLHQSTPGHRRVLQCQPTINNEIIKSCADISDDLAVFGEGETVIRTKSDAWVLGKLSNQRHLYVVVTRKNAELTEICDEVRRVRSLLFKDILLVE